METNHIKGNWAIYGDVDGQTAICDEDSTIIAYLDNWTGSSEGKKASNARLIAAAPDLLAALRCALADLEGALQAHCDSNPHGHDWKAHALSIDEAHAAIAKASGEQLSNL